MSFINPCHRGLAYGDGYMQGDGQLGHLVSLAGNDLFEMGIHPNLFPGSSHGKSEDENWNPDLEIKKQYKYCLQLIYKN